MQENIIIKIKKLLTLSESSNENEAKVAMLKAQELLVKHKLTMKDINNLEVEDIKITKGISKVSFTKAKWKGQLARVIADNFSCYLYFTSYYSNTCVFYGKEEDVNVCNIVLDYAMDCINTNVKKFKYQYKKEGKSTAGLETDYGLGFTNGLRESFKRQKENNQEWALMLQIDPRVEEAYEQLRNGFKKKKGISLASSYNGHIEAYNHALEEGKKFSITDKISNEGTEDRVLI